MKITRMTQPARSSVHRIINTSKWLLTVSLFATITNVNSAVIYSQTPSTITGLAVSRQSTVMVADDFTLTSDQTIKSISWLGAYWPPTSPLFPGIDDFVINIYSDSSGVGTLLQSVAIGNDVVRNNTGNLFAGRDDLYEFSANLGSGINLTSDTYWVSIFYPDLSDDNYFLWAGNNFGSSTGNHMSSYDGGSSWRSNNPFGLDMYFILNDTEVSSVPIPQALWLFSSGLLGLIGISRRKKAA